MKQSCECGDGAALVTYLYDEAGPVERQQIEAHVAVCPACAADLAALTSTSAQLAAWLPPEADLGFHVVARAPAATAHTPARWWRQPLPVWAQAVAAVLVFGIGLSLGILRGSGAGSGLGTGLGAGPDVPAPTGTQATGLPAPRTGTLDVSRGDLAALEGRLRAELSQVRAIASRSAAQDAASQATAPNVTGPVSDAQMLARVRALIDESEQRQRRELALRTAGVVRDMDAQRQIDMGRIQRVFGQFEGTAGAEIQRQRQDLNDLIRVSQRPQ
jgi:hypothetical protein